MKRIVEVSPDESGLLAAIGENVLFLCANYFYYGRLVGVNDGHVELSDPHIVYDTGDWTNAPNWSDAQKLPVETLNVQIGFVESWAVL